MAGLESCNLSDGILDFYFKDTPIKDLQVILPRLIELHKKAKKKPDHIVNPRTGKTIRLDGPTAKVIIAQLKADASVTNRRDTTPIASPLPAPTMRPATKSNIGTPQPTPIETQFITEALPPPPKDQPKPPIKIPLPPVFSSTSVSSTSVSPPSLPPPTPPPASTPPPPPTAKVVPTTKEVVATHSEGCLKTVEQYLLENPKSTVWEVIVKQNRCVKRLLNLVDKKTILPAVFRKNAGERYSNNMWGMKGHNYIDFKQSKCKHDCKYCYVKFLRGGIFVPDIEDVQATEVSQAQETNQAMITNQAKITQVWPLAKNEARQHIFFPSMSDVFVENVTDYLTIAQNIMNAGHEIMFTTKPTFEMIQEFIKQYQERGLDKEKMHIFVTITTDDTTTIPNTNIPLLKSMETNCPSYMERIKCIMYLIYNGFIVNVMMEPYLSDPVPIIDHLRPILHGRDNIKRGGGMIAIGKMKYAEDAVFHDDPDTDKQLHQYFSELYTRKNTEQIWNEIKDDDHIFLKMGSIDLLLSYFKVR
jgi:hypothetical protein